MQIGIFVKTEAGEIHSLHVHSNETVDGLKNLIEDVVGILPGTVPIVYWNPVPSSTGLPFAPTGYHPELFFERKRLEDRKGLTTDYGICDQCIIDVELAESYGALRGPRAMRPKAWAVVLFDWDGEMKVKYLLYMNEEI